MGNFFSSSYVKKQKIVWLKQLTKLGNLFPVSCLEKQTKKKESFKDKVTDLRNYISSSFKKQLTVD